jgi:uncharacterized protein YqhQ
MRKYLYFIVAGILFGTLSTLWVHGWYTIIPWIIATLIVGWLNPNRQAAVTNGAIFGYMIFLSYIFAGYKGKTDTKTILLFILFNFGFSLVGSVAGLLGGFIGNWLRRLK